MRRHVLTGGPGVGKSTLLELLAERGYTVVPEVARAIIKHEQYRGSDVLPWKDLKKFQDTVADMQFKYEQTVVSLGDVFLDRSLVDGHAFSILGNIEPSPLVEKWARKRYDTVFLLEPLPMYVGDKDRKESAEEAAKIHEAIARSYETFGYTPVPVPVLPPEKRVQFIIEKLGLK